MWFELTEEKVEDIDERGRRWSWDEPEDWSETMNMGSEASRGSLVGLVIGDMRQAKLWRALHIQQKHLDLQNKIGGFLNILTRKHH